MATKTATTTLTAREVQTALGRAKDVSFEEETTLRMRHGIGVSKTAPLARKAAEGSEPADELLLVEMQLLKAYRAHVAAQQAKPRVTSKAAAVAAVARPVSSNRAKDKIVRALRKKR